MISVVHKVLVKRLEKLGYVFDYKDGFVLVKYVDAVVCINRNLHLTKVEARVFLRELRSLGLCKINKSNIKIFLR